MTIVTRTIVNSTNYSSATKLILNWAMRRESRYICVANVHMLMEGYDSDKFNTIVNNADLSVPDGMPVVWMMRLKGLRRQERVYGPTLMLHVLKAAERNKISIGFYGSKEDVLGLLVAKVESLYPDLRIDYAYSPPFRQLEIEEDAEIIRDINQSGVRILFVGLGCPKQEVWMAEHREKVNAVMLGVGAAFDFHAGVTPQAPTLLQTLGLEWLFRLAVEPRRLWWRYLYHNPRFLVLAIADLLGILDESDGRGD